MITVGITGGIGSGKSVVSKILESMGYAVFNSDLEAKAIVNHNEIVRKELIALCGPKVYNEQGLNREFLAQLIFSDDSIRENVNAIIHPKVREAFEDFAAGQDRFAFNEAAILCETGGNKKFDRMILVTAPKELKVKRVMKRDQCTEDEVLARMNKQWSDEQKIPLADIVIVNDEQSPLIRQVEESLKALLTE